MTLISSESAVQGMRQRLLEWCRGGAAEYGGRCYRAQIERWIAATDDRMLASMIGTTEHADAQATACIAELGELASQCAGPREDVVALVTHLLEGPGDLSAERVCLLRGALLGSLASQALALEAARRRRHDVTSQLQAALLNLELMMIDHQGDATQHQELAVIKKSLDSAVLLVTHPDSDNGILNDPGMNP